jgi:hypothetical protein
MKGRGEWLTCRAGGRNRASAAPPGNRSPPMPTLSPPSSLAELLAEPVNLGETGQRGNLLRRLLWVEGLVDPHGLRQPSGVGGSRTNRSGWAPVGALQHLLAGSEDLFGAAEVHVGGGQQADPGVVVLHVVPVEEALAEGAGILDAAEPVREGGVVLEGLELALRVRVVVGDVWPGMGADDAQVGQWNGDRLGGHRAAPVGVDGERARLDLLG